MKFHYMSLRTSASLAAFVVVLGLWAISFRVGMNVMAVCGRARYELVVCHGSLSGLQLGKWWLSEPPKSQLVPPADVPKSLDEWVGMNPLTHHSLLGLEWANGEYTTPFIKVTESTKFTYQPINFQIGSHYMTDHPFRFLGINLLCPALVFSILPTRYLIQVVRSPRSQNRAGGHDAVS